MKKGFVLLKHAPQHARDHVLRPHAKPRPIHHWVKVPPRPKEGEDPGYQMHAEDVAFLILLALILYALFFR